MKPIARAITGRLLAVAAGLEPRSAEKLRGCAARMIAGEVVEPGELAALLPRRPEAAGITVGLDASYALVLQNAYELHASGVAVMCLDGPVYYDPSLFDALIFGVVPTALFIEALDAATEDEAVETLVLKQHCPGGSVAGLSDIAAAVDRFKAAGKRLVAFAGEMICSSGMWWSCAADQIVLTPTAYVGNIGTIMPFYDSSKFFQELGVVPAFIASSTRKGLGHDGVAVTPEISDDCKRLVDRHAGEFFARVAQGRSRASGKVVTPEQVRGLDARIYLGQDAVGVNLADRVVGSWREYLDELTGARGASGDDDAGSSGAGGPAAPNDPAQPDKETPMDLKSLTVDELKTGRPDLVNLITASGKAEALKEAAEKAPKPASIADLKQAFPGAENAGFREDCAEKGLTIDQAKAARAVDLGAKVTELQGKVAALETENANLKKLGNEGRGSDPVAYSERGGGGGGGGGATGKFEDLVKAKVAADKCSLNEAINSVRISNAKAHEDWLDRKCPKIVLA